MQIFAMAIQNFRGFEGGVVRPKNHVVVVGVPNAGRSTLIEALSRVLDAEASRTRVTTELDFNSRTTSEPVRIRLVIGDLGEDLKQQFFDHLELWDTTAGKIVPESEHPEDTDADGFEWVLRLEYRAVWLAPEERSEEFVHYPKHEQPAAGTYVHARRSDIESLGYGNLRLSAGRILELGGRSMLRRLIERSPGGDFAQALQTYEGTVSVAAGSFTSSDQVMAALEEVFQPLRELLGLDAADLKDHLTFAPDGGSISGLLRSLGPSVDLNDGGGSLPAWRHGSTTVASFVWPRLLPYSMAQASWRSTT